MEKIYKPDAFFASDSVDIDKFCNEFMELAAPFEDSGLQQHDEDLLNFFGLPSDPAKLEKLATLTNIKTLTVPGEIEMEMAHGTDNRNTSKRCNDYVLPDKAKHLKTIQMVEMRRKHTLHVGDNRDTYTLNLKYRSQVRINYDPPDEEMVDLQAGKEVVIVIQMFVPYRYVTGVKMHWNPKFNHEIEVLGSTTLTQFKEKILCPSSQGGSSDISRILGDQSLEEIPKVEFKSSVICIGDTLYHDDLEDVDYTTPILEWVQKRRLVAGPFNKKNMSETHFRDLKVRLGYPYMFQHLGDCEHLLTISDIRILHSTDSLSSADYPRYSATTKSMPKYCLICGVYVSKIVVTGCDRLINDPAYLCHDCFKSYLYIDGKKIGEFQAFLYYDYSSIM